MDDQTIAQMTLIAKQQIEASIMQHLALCPFAVADVERRLRMAETSFARLSGFMLGAGLLGGTAGAAVAKIFGG